jgi:hypothetical protein
MAVPPFKTVLEAWLPGIGRHLGQGTVPLCGRAVRAGSGRVGRTLESSKKRRFRRCTGRLNATQPGVIAVSTPYIRGLDRSCKLGGPIPAVAYPAGHPSDRKQYWNHGFASAHSPEVLERYCGDVARTSEGGHQRRRSEVPDSLAANLGSGTSDRKRHWNHRFASAHSLPKSAKGIAAMSRGLRKVGTGRRRGRATVIVIHKCTPRCR